MNDLSQARVAEIFVEFSDTLVDDFDLIEFLQMVTMRASEATGIADAVLHLADPQGSLRFMAASNEGTELLELLHVLTQEGPCTDCFRRGEPVLVADLVDVRERWASFAPQSVAAGFRSVHAFPMRLRSQTIGVLALVGPDVGTMVPGDIRVIQALTDVATIGLLQEQAIRRGDILAVQLREALDSRIVIEQAKGAISQKRGCSVDAAFDLLRAYCRNRGLGLSAVARAVVSDSSLVDVLSP